MSTHSSSISDTPTEALMELLAPDGYYTYLGVQKPAAAAAAINKNGTDPATAAAAAAAAAAAPSKNETINEDTIKKNYRKLSLRHHPDKGGDVDTFRLLNRAQKVLTTPKLRQQYDILGIDLDDDEEEAAHDHEEEGKEHLSSSQKIVQEIASSVLTTVIQLGVRTVMMGAVSVFVVRYWWLLYPALLFFAFIIFRIFQQISSTPGGSITDTIPPSLIAVGLCIMYTSAGSDGWNKQFWLGESVVIGMFCYNSLNMPELQQNNVVRFGVAVFSLLAALWFRGRFWNYVIVVGLIAVIALLVAVAFPIMELLLEAILNEKLKKVGDKVRHHHQILQKHYAQKAN